MNTPTYKEQFDKITTAYFKGKLIPSNDCACFIGNLLNGEEGWAQIRHFNFRYPFGIQLYREVATCAIRCINEESGNLYTEQDIYNLEKNFLFICYADKVKGEGGIFVHTEDNLFNAMSSTLDMLRDIHISKGEIVDPIPFKQRAAVTL